MACEHGHTRSKGDPERLPYGRKRTRLCCNKIRVFCILSPEAKNKNRDRDSGRFRPLWLHSPATLGVRRATRRPDTGCANPAGGGRHSEHGPNEPVFPHRIGPGRGTYRRSDLVSRRVRVTARGRLAGCVGCAWSQIRASVASRIFWRNMGCVRSWSPNSCRA